MPRTTKDRFVTLELRFDSCSKQMPLVKIPLAFHLSANEHIIKGRRSPGYTMKEWESNIRILKSAVTKLTQQNKDMTTSVYDDHKYQMTFLLHTRDGVTPPPESKYDKQVFADIYILTNMTMYTNDIADLERQLRDTKDVVSDNSSLSVYSSAKKVEDSCIFTQFIGAFSGRTFYPVASLRKEAHSTEEFQATHRRFVRMHEEPLNDPLYHVKRYKLTQAMFRNLVKDLVTFQEKTQYGTKQEQQEDENKIKPKDKKKKQCKPIINTSSMKLVSYVRMSKEEEREYKEYVLTNRHVLNMAKKFGYQDNLDEFAVFPTSKSVARDYVEAGKMKRERVRRDSDSTSSVQSEQFEVGVGQELS